ncbi:MAG TPA: hypothetical protein VIT67_15975, partial [Povalibacter sp.]
MLLELFEPTWRWSALRRLIASGVSACAIAFLFADKYSQAVPVDGLNTAPSSGGELPPSVYRVFCDEPG